MKDVKAKVLGNEEIIPGYFKLTLDVPYIAQAAQPGQFVQIKCSDSLDPLLRRPFSIHRLSTQHSTPTGIEVLYKVIGKGTGLLSRKKRGGFIDVLGPLGRGFTLPLSLSPNPLSTILIAGGMGVAPLVFLAEKLMEIRRQKAKARIAVLIGAKTKKVILCEKNFKKIGVEVYIATDDGSRGYKGFVSNLFKKKLSSMNGEISTIYTCGPAPMMRDIADICIKRKIDCEVSLERMMACGIGVCLGCAVKIKNGAYKLACKDGPVFNASDIRGHNQGETEWVD